MPVYGKLKKFYNSKPWRQLRLWIYTTRNGVCERCGTVCLKGEFNVHHKITLTEDNYSNPNISLNPDLLELLCIDCHNEEEGRFQKKKERLKFDSNGEIIF